MEFIGQKFPISDELAQALQGQTATDLSALNKPENVSEQAQFASLFEVYIPIRARDQKTIVAAYEIYHDLSVLQPRLDDLRQFVLLSMGGGFIVLYLSLFAIVRAASRELVRRNREIAHLYEHTEEQAKKLAELFSDLESSYDATLAALSEALDARDRATLGHSRRVADLSCQVARTLGVTDEKEMASIERGALLHDIGKIGIADRILLKPGPLTEDERAEMRKHPELGAHIVERVPFLRDALPIILYHQERYDGSGYPAGLRAQEIPLAARIFAVVDVYDALTNKRPYHDALDADSTLREIETLRGVWFDPKIVDAFVQVIRSSRA